MFVFSQGLVQTKCPTSSYRKQCTGNIWRWIHSGTRLTFNDWNTQSGEPNGGTEHCVTMWLKGDFRYVIVVVIKVGSQYQLSFVPGGEIGSAAPPLIQDTPSDPSAKRTRMPTSRMTGTMMMMMMRVNSDLEVVTALMTLMAMVWTKRHNIRYTIKNTLTIYKLSFTDDGGPFLPDELRCVDNGVVYKSNSKLLALSGDCFPGCNYSLYITGNGNDKLNTIFNVESAQMCREFCSENSECFYWTWINKRNRKCVLKRGIKNSRFRKQKNKAVSGTMLNNCRINNNNNGNGQTNQALTR